MDKIRGRSIRRRGMEFRSITNGVGALIYAQNTGRYLFLLRSSGSWSHTWGIPGGKVDPGESTVEGLNREIHEELGGKIIDPKFVPIEMFTSGNEQFVYHTYFIAVNYEFVPELNDEHIGYAWVPLTAVPNPLHPGLQRTLTTEDIVKKIQVAEENHRVAC